MTQPDNRRSSFLAPIQAEQDMQHAAAGTDLPQQRTHLSTWLVTIMCALRALIGIGATFAPDATLKSYGVESGAAPLLTYLSRLFGVREIALASGTLASREDARSLWLQLGIGCDLIDAGAALLAARDGALGKRGTLQATVGPGLAIGIALYALATRSNSKA